MKKVRILFQGDSITAGGRGTAVGYPVHAERILKEKLPDVHFEFLNTAVWGNKLCDFSVRMEEDIFKLAPDIICLLIGVNNVLSFEPQLIPSAEEFGKEYEAILVEIKKNTKAKLLILEPFMFENEPMRGHKIPYLLKNNEKVKEIAPQYADEFLPTQGILFSLGEGYGYKEMTVDGLHLSDFGARVIGEVVAEKLEKLAKELI